MSLFAIPPIGISSPNPVLLPMVTLITSTSGQAGRCLEYLCEMLSLCGFACPLIARLYTGCIAVLKLIPRVVTLSSS